MKAAVINEFGDVDVFKYTDVATPTPRAGQVLVKVLAAGVNRFDHYIREGSVTPELDFPHILGADAAGEVAELGPGVNGLTVRDRVVVVAGFPQAEADYDIYPASLAPSFTLPGLGIPGAYAQYVEIPARYVVSDETGLDPAEVATLPMVLATSVRAVKEVGGVQRGDKVLVQAGELYYERAARIAHDVDEAKLAVSELGSPSGILRVAVPSGVGRELVISAIPAFLACHAGIKIVMSMKEAHA